MSPFTDEEKRARARCEYRDKVSFPPARPDPRACPWCGFTWCRGAREAREYR